MAWVTKITDRNVVQVIPLNDDGEHTEEVEWESLPFDDAPVSKCSCDTRREINSNGMWVLIHQSFDGREGVEWAAEILK
jgi:hypothetical protein